MVEKFMGIGECREILEGEGIELERQRGWYDMVFSNRKVKNVNMTLIRKYCGLLKAGRRKSADKFLRERIDRSRVIVEVLR